MLTLPALFTPAVYNTHKMPALLTPAVLNAVKTLPTLCSHSHYTLNVKMLAMLTTKLMPNTINASIVHTSQYTINANIPNITLLMTIL